MNNNNPLNLHTQSAPDLMEVCFHQYGNDDKAMTGSKPVYMHYAVANAVLRCMVKSFMGQGFTQDQAIALVQSTWLRHSMDDDFMDFIFPAVDLWVRHGAVKNPSRYLERGE